MADKGLYLIDVRIRPCAYMKDVVNGSWSNLVDGSKAVNGKVIYGFKVVGENRLIVVLDGGVESAVSTLTVAYGEQVEVTCTPLRTYEGFAKNVLGIDDDQLTQPSSHKLGSDGIIFFIHFVVEYKGKTASEVLGTWKREAEKVLGLRGSGDLEIDLYKVVGQREVYGLTKLPDAEIMDDISFTLPIMKEMGDQVHVTTKVLRPFS